MAGQKQDASVHCRGDDKEEKGEAVGHAGMCTTTSSGSIGPLSAIVSGAATTMGNIIRTGEPYAHRGIVDHEATLEGVETNTKSILAVKCKMGIAMNNMTC